jgi:DNA polymerase
LACENVTQATAHDLLRISLRRLDEAGFEVIAHVHDEIIVEHPTIEAEDAAERIRNIMVTPPAWGKDIPLAAEGEVMLRYHK